MRAHGRLYVLASLPYVLASLPHLPLHADARAAEDGEPDEAEEGRARKAPMDHVLDRPPLPRTKQN